MKKCPTCEKTFDDNLRFCQTDGTPLVAVAEETPEDPFKTIVANQSDLPGLPEDPLKAVVGGMPGSEQFEPSKDAAGDMLDLENHAEPIDPLKTMIASDFKGFSAANKPDAAEVSAAADVPPPSPFSEPAAVPEPEAAISDVMSSASPEPPKFSEPDITPPDFGNLAESSPAVSESAASSILAAPAPDETEADAVASAEPKAELESRSANDNDFSSASPFGNAENIPIPSPFGEAKPSTFQPPAPPVPAYQEPQETPPPFSPFSKPEDPGQPMQAMDWSPPPPPMSGWQDQQIGQNTPFQPPPAAAAGLDQTMSVISLVLGILSILFCFGFLSGIPALITGYIARKRISESPSFYGGGTMAMVGMILGGVGTALSVLSVIGWIILVVLANA